MSYATAHGFAAQAWSDALLGFEVDARTRYDVGPGVTLLTRPTKTTDADGNEIWTTESKAVLPFGLRLAGRVKLDGVVVGLAVLVTTKDGNVRQAYAPVVGMTGTVSSATPALKALGEPLDGTQTAQAIQWLAAASRCEYGACLDVLSQPMIVNGQMLVPGINASGEPDKAIIPFPSTDADEAAEAWRSILITSAKYPTLGVLIGAAIISIYLEHLEAHGSTYHSEGDSTRGKTQGNETAMAAVGDPHSTALRSNWDTTLVALGYRLTGARGLPQMLDETSTAQPNERKRLFRSAIFLVHDSHGRARGLKAGGVEELECRPLNLLSTGEESLVVDGATGAFARVHSLRFPITTDPADIAELDFAHAQAVTYAGWPIRWVLAGRLPERDDLQVPYFESPLARRHAEALAAARLGWRLLRDVLLPDSEIDLDISAVVADVEEDSDRQTAAERLHEALWQDYVARSDEYSFSGSRGLRGFVQPNEFDGAGAVAYFPDTVQEIADRLQVGVSTAMRELRRNGKLATKDGRLQKQVKVNGKPTWMYVVANLYTVEAPLQVFAPEA
jgi:hypothetical protein